MQTIYYDNGYIVPPMSVEKIHNLARAIRIMNADCIDESGRIDIMAVLEFNNIHYSYKPDEEMGQILGLTMSNGDIFLRESIGDGAIIGDGRSRFTVAHELGHYAMHKDHIGLARPVSSSTKVYCNAEWQANEFAGALLLPNELIIKNGHLSVEQLADKFGVSIECAQTRINKLNKKSSY